MSQGRLGRGTTAKTIDAAQRNSKSALAAVAHYWWDQGANSTTIARTLRTSIAFILLGMTRHHRKP